MPHFLTLLLPTVALSLLSWPSYAQQAPAQATQQATLAQQPEAEQRFVISCRSLAPADHKPLFVIDGVPATAERISRLTPADVESIDVLAAEQATALYGSTATYGALLIRTKAPRKRPAALLKQAQQHPAPSQP